MDQAGLAILGGPGGAAPLQSCVSLYKHLRWGHDGTNNRGSLSCLRFAPPLLLFLWRLIQKVGMNYTARRTNIGTTHHP